MFITKKGIPNVLTYFATVRAFSRDARLLLATQALASISTQEMTPKHWRATMAGAATMASGIGQAVMSMGGGYLIAGVGYGAFYWLGALLGAFSALFFAGYLYRSARQSRGSVFV